MKEWFKNAWTWVSLAVLICLFLWVVQGSSFFMYKFFATKVEQVRYDTFKESQSYNDGMASELQAMQLNYVKADKEGKAAIASIILHRYASYDTTKLPPDLQVFLKEIKNERGLK